jgi:hypothetical protein
MVRTEPATMRERVRFSQEALNGGLTFASYAAAFMSAVAAHSAVEAVEMIIATDVMAVRRLVLVAKRVRKALGAMNKMVTEMRFDCSTCDYAEVCSTIEELGRLREMRQAGMAM